MHAVGGGSGTADEIRAGKNRSVAFEEGQESPKAGLTTFRDDTDRERARGGSGGYRDRRDERPRDFDRRRDDRDRGNDRRRDDRHRDYDRRRGDRDYGHGHDRDVDWRRRRSPSYALLPSLM